MVSSVLVVAPDSGVARLAIIIRRKECSSGGDRMDFLGLGGLDGVGSVGGTGEAGGKVCGRRAE